MKKEQDPISRHYTIKPKKIENRELKKLIECIEEETLKRATNIQLVIATII